MGKECSIRFEVKAELSARRGRWKFDGAFDALAFDNRVDGNSKPPPAFGHQTQRVPQRPQSLRARAGRALGAAAARRVIQEQSYIEVAGRFDARRKYVENVELGFSHVS